MRPPTAKELRFVLTCLDRLREVYPDDIDRYANVMIGIIYLLLEDE